MCGRIILSLHFNIWAAYVKRLDCVCSCFSVSQVSTLFVCNLFLFTKFLPFRKPNPHLYKVYIYLFTEFVKVKDHYITKVTHLDNSSLSLFVVDANMCWCYQDFWGSLWHWSGYIDFTIVSRSRCSLDFTSYFEHSEKLYIAVYFYLAYGYKTMVGRSFWKKRYSSQPSPETCLYLTTTTDYIIYT